MDARDTHNTILTITVGYHGEAPQNTTSAVIDSLTVANELASRLQAVEGANITQSAYGRGTLKTNVPRGTTEGHRSELIYANHWYLQALCYLRHGREYVSARTTCSEAT